MTLLYLAYRNMVSKPLNLTLSLLLLILSIALVTFSTQLSLQLEGKLNKNIAPFDMVVGAKGSPLQLVLSSILHIDNPTGNIELKDTKSLRSHPFVKTAIPISYGDNYKGYRILGSTKQFISHYKAELSTGKLNKNNFEIVAGYQVAKKLNLTVGATFASSHGLVDSDLDMHDEHLFVITGVLKPSGTVVDQLLITNLESIWEAHDHNPEAHDESEDHDHGHKDDHNHKDQEDEVEDYGHESDKEITSLLVKFKNPMGMVQLPRSINEDTKMQAALPSYEIQRLTGLIGSGVKTIYGIALAILLVSGLSIFIGILKTIRERKRELALLRTYGLQKYQLLFLAVSEGVFLAFLGFIFGWIVGRIGLTGLSMYTESVYGYTLSIEAPNSLELKLLVLIFALSIMASLLASISIFKLNVVKTLSHE